MRVVNGSAPSYRLLIRSRLLTDDKTFDGSKLYREGLAGRVFDAIALYRFDMKAGAAVALHLTLVDVGPGPNAKPTGVRGCPRPTVSQVDVINGADD